MAKRPLLLSALIVVAAALSSCGKADVKQASSQVAAKVNGDEISVHQLHNAIARVGGIPPGQEVRKASAQALDRIIDQELLVQRAVKARLDRDPQVMQTIEFAKRQILAQAYIDRAVSAASTGMESREEIRKFYKANPVLFERRRIYRYQDLQVTAPPESLDVLNAAAAGAKRLDDVAQWLKPRKLPFHVTTASTPAEQVPMNILSRLSEMRDGQIAVIPTSRGASVVELLQSQESPLSEQQAAPIIERYLHGRRQLEVAQAEVRKLREQAKIEYIGEFETARPAALQQPVASGASLNGGVKDAEDVRKDLGRMR